MGSSAEVQVVDSDREADEAAGAESGQESGQVIGGSAPAVAETAVDGTAVCKDEAAVVTAVAARAGLMPALDLVRPVCEKCRFFVDPLQPSVRMTNKSKQLFMCGSCNSKMVMMSRVADNFVEESSGFSDEDKVAFMRLRGGLREYKAKCFHPYISSNICAWTMLVSAARPLRDAGKKQLRDAIIMYICSGEVCGPVCEETH